MSNGDVKRQAAAVWRAVQARLLQTTYAFDFGTCDGDAVGFGDVVTGVGASDAEERRFERLCVALARRFRRACSSAAEIAALRGSPPPPPVGTALTFLAARAPATARRWSRLFTAQLEDAERRSAWMQLAEGAAARASVSALLVLASRRDAPEVQQFLFRRLAAEDDPQVFKVVVQALGPALGTPEGWSRLLERLATLPPKDAWLSAARAAGAAAGSALARLPDSFSLFVFDGACLRAAAAAAAAPWCFQEEVRRDLLEFLAARVNASDEVVVADGMEEILVRALAPWCEEAAVQSVLLAALDAVRRKALGWDESAGAALIAGLKPLWARPEVRSALLDVALAGPDGATAAALAEFVTAEGLSAAVAAGLRSSDPAVRAGCARVLTGAPLGSRVVTALTRALSDPVEGVRLAAARALLGFVDGSGAPSAVLSGAPYDGLRVRTLVRLARHFEGLGSWLDAAIERLFLLKATAPALGHTACESLTMCADEGCFLSSEERFRSVPVFRALTGRGCSAADEVLAAAAFRSAFAEPVEVGALVAAGAGATVGRFRRLPFWRAATAAAGADGVRGRRRLFAVPPPTSPEAPVGRHRPDLGLSDGRAA